MSNYTICLSDQDTFELQGNGNVICTGPIIPSPLEGNRSSIYLNDDTTDEELLTKFAMVSIHDWLTLGVDVELNLSEFQELQVHDLDYKFNFELIIENYSRRKTIESYVVKRKLKAEFYVFLEEEDDQLEATRFITYLIYKLTELSFDVLSTNESDLIVLTVEFDLSEDGHLSDNLHDICVQFETLIAEIAIIWSAKESQENENANNSKPDEILRKTFQFPPEIEAACIQYILYFIEFAKMHGEKIQLDVAQRKSETFLTISQSSPKNSSNLETINNLFETFLKFPSGQVTYDKADKSPENRLLITSLELQVQNLLQQIECKKALIDLKDEKLKLLNEQVLGKSARETQELKICEGVYLPVNVYYRKARFNLLEIKNKLMS